jgi:hypothetical protein
MNEQIKHKWLPSKPTQEMLEAEQFASSLAYESSEVEAVEVYKTMWQAAPEVEQEPVAFIDMKMFPPIRFPEGQLRCDVEHLDGLALYTHQQPKREPFTVTMHEVRESLMYCEINHCDDPGAYTFDILKRLGIGVE